MKKRILAALLILVMVVGMLPVSAFAAEGESTAATAADSTAGKTAQVYLTVSNKGVLAKAADNSVMAERVVTVRDLDGDDVLTYHEALIAAHEAYCPDGYATADSAYGTYVTKLWGVNKASSLFMVNNQALTMGVADSSSTVQDGDHLCAAVMKDSTDYSDYYAYFDKNALEVKANEEFTLELKGFMGMGYQPTPEVLKDIKIGTWSNGTFTQIEAKTTDAEGKVKLSFATSGTYYVTAQGEVADVTVTDYNGTPVENTYPTKQVKAPIIAPVCVVEVVESGSAGDSTNWTFNKSTGTLRISGTGATTNWSYNSRAPWNGYLADIKTIIVEEGVTAIGQYAFNGYTATAKVYLPKTLQKIEMSSFYNVRADILYYGTQAQWQSVTGSGKSTVDKLSITYNYGRTDIALIQKEAEGGWFAKGEDGTNALKLTITKPEGLDNITVKWYVSDTNSTSAGTEVESSKVSTSEDGLTLFCTPDLTAVGEKYYYCEITSTLTAETVKVISKTAKVKCVEADEKIWNGHGVESDPFKLNNAEDLTKLSNYVAAGHDAEGLYFAITDNITLPADWTPIGAPKEGETFTSDITLNKMNLFKGHIDGAKNDDSGESWTITVPSGGMTMVGAIVGGSIKNLNIYGEKINSAGVVAYYFNMTQSNPHNILIENVTLKSGSHTKYSGFIGGYASSVNTVTIRNCTVEEGVIVGDDGTFTDWTDMNAAFGFPHGPTGVQNNDMIGSFGGAMSGTIENCVSHAKVYGRDYVGGILGFKGQSMGDCVVKNCTFDGEVHASGNYAGGIIGAGYISTSAPNTPATTIQNCVVSGLVEGKEYVGGLLGGEGIAQCWNNGVGYIQNNKFIGTLRSSGTYVGGIIGYMRSLNRYTIINDNLYASVYKGIGGVQYVDTNKTGHETASGATYLNTESDTTGCPTIAGLSWKTEHNRTDDPLGKDAEKLAKKITLKKIEVSGSCKTNYLLGEELDLTGLTFIAHWSDNTTSPIPSGAMNVSGFNAARIGKQIVSLEFGGKNLRFEANVESVTATITIEKTGTDGTNDIYTITFADGTTTTFTVSNGAAGAQGEKGDKGDTGAAGTDGTDGTDGKDGANGKDGVDGLDGKDAIPTTAGESTDGKLAIVATILAGVSLIGNVALAIFLLMKKKNEND